MGEIRLLLVWDALFELGVKGLWISGEDIAHCILTLLLEILRVVTSQTATNLPAVYFDRKTLTVELEAFRLLAGATHGCDLFSVIVLNLTGTSGAVSYRYTPICVEREQAV